VGLRSDHDRGRFFGQTKSAGPTMRLGAIPLFDVTKVWRSSV